LVSRTKTGNWARKLQSLEPLFFFEQKMTCQHTCIHSEILILELKEEATFWKNRENIVHGVLPLIFDIFWCVFLYCNIKFPFCGQSVNCVSFKSRLMTLLREDSKTMHYFARLVWESIPSQHFTYCVLLYMQELSSVINSEVKFCLWFAKSVPVFGQEKAKVGNIKKSNEKPLALQVCKLRRWIVNLEFPKSEFFVN